MPTIKKNTTDIQSAEKAAAPEVLTAILMAGSDPAARDKLGLCAYDYDVFLEGSSIAQGSSATQTTVINPNATALIHVPMSMDLVKIFTNGDTKNVINFVRNLMDYGNGTPSNVSVKFTPYLNTVNGTGKGAKMPTITLNKTFQ